MLEKMWLLGSVLAYFGALFGAFTNESVGMGIANFFLISACYCRIKKN